MNVQQIMTVSHQPQSAILTASLARNVAMTKIVSIIPTDHIVIKQLVNAQLKLMVARQIQIVSKGCFATFQGVCVLRAWKIAIASKWSFAKKTVVSVVVWVTKIATMESNATIISVRLGAKMTKIASIIQAEHTA